MSISFQCPRCGMALTVPDEKAGKLGRCPTCAGPIKVPVPPPRKTPTNVTFQQTPTLKPILLIGIPLILLAVGIIFIMNHRSRPATIVGEVEDSGAASEAVRQWADENYRVKQLDALAHDYQKLMALERRYRARHVLSKIRNYEAVSDFEAELRRNVLEEQSKAAAAQAAGAEEVDWKLDTPLSPGEKAEFDRMAQELQRQTLDIEHKLGRVNLAAPKVTDPLGRTLLSIDDILARIAVRREELKARQATLK